MYLTMGWQLLADDFFKRYGNKTTDQQTVGESP